MNDEMAKKKPQPGKALEATQMAGCPVKPLEDLALGNCNPLRGQEGNGKLDN